MASRRHSESDMKLIRNIRKSIKSAGDLLVELGDDGLEDDAAGEADTSLPTKSYKANSCVDWVTQVLAETYFLGYKAHAAHWNTESLNFPQYHAFFEMVYEQMDAAVDPLAEFIRALGAKAPATIMALAVRVPMESQSESDTLASMIAGITADNLTLIDTIQSAITATGMESQYGVQNYLQERLAVHQKLAWMLRSIESVPAEMPTVPVELELEAPEPAETEAELSSLADRNATDKERQDMPEDDFIIPETRDFPVVTPDDIPAAVSSWGRYRGDIDFETFKARLIALAQRKGPEFVAALPAEWLKEIETTAKSIRDLARRILFGGA